MGEVWRATDTKLNRDVAIKILPEAFAQDQDRMVRFEREAQVLASLNHPNIAAIYGVEERALVMELVEGETLHGRLPIKTALNYAKQISAPPRSRSLTVSESDHSIRIRISRRTGSDGGHVPN
jgi:serine/threonine-protein kinase